MPTAEPTQRIDYCAPSVALAFLFAAAGYASPVALFPGSHPLNGSMSPEILNLYCLVAWMGLAHFIYAYHGQARALAKTPANAVPFLIALSLGAAALIGLRSALGWMLFSVLMWIYFIPHFVRAELLFGSVLEQEPPASYGWAVYWFPSVAFTFLAVALFAPLNIAQNHWLMLGTALAIIAFGVCGGVHKAVSAKNTSAYMLLACFLIAEALTWAMYRKYMVFQFQQGVFVFHVALASFYHYFRSYDFAMRTKFKNACASACLKYLAGIIAINAAVVGTGAAVLFYGANTPANLLFGVTFFTFWVGLHQFASDAFALLKKPIGVFGRRLAPDARPEAR